MEPTPYQAELHAAHKARLARLWPAKQPRKPVDIVYKPTIAYKPMRPCPPLPPPQWLAVLIPNRLNSVILLCARYFGMTLTELKSERRSWPIVRQRQITMYIARNATLRSLPEIGRKLLRDHTSVLHGIRTIERLMRTDWQIAYDVAMIERELGL